MVVDRISLTMLVKRIDGLDGVALVGRDRTDPRP